MRSRLCALAYALPLSCLAVWSCRARLGRLALPACPPVSPLSSTSLLQVILKSTRPLRAILNKPVPAWPIENVSLCYA